MTEPTVRGYMILGCFDYIDTFEPALRERVYATLPSDGCRSRESYDQMQWYPVDHCSDLYRGIVSLHGDDEAKAREALLGCGKFIAHAATNTFLRLLMRIMTPRVFARKAPDFWARDSRCGRMETDTSQLGDRRLIVRLHDIGAFAHTAPVAAGFGAFALTACGVKDLSVKISDWSLATPAPSDVDIEMSWS